MTDTKPRLLCIVEETFHIRGRGIVVAPGICAETEGEFKTGDRIVFIDSGGKAYPASIEGIEMLTPNPRRIYPILISGIEGKIKKGMEVWSITPR